MSRECAGVARVLSWVGLDKILDESLRRGPLDQVNEGAREAYLLVLLGRLQPLRRERGCER